MFSGVDPMYIRIGGVVIAFATCNPIAKLASLCDRAGAEIDVELRQRP